MVLNTEYIGSSEPYGFWKTGCTRRRRRSSSVRLRLATRSPSKVTVPDVGSSRPSTICATVDLPDPDSPTKAVVVPRGMRKLTSSTAGTMVFCHGMLPRTAKTLVRLSTLMTSSGACAPTTAAASAAASSTVSSRSDAVPPADRSIRRDSNDGAACTSRLVYGWRGFCRISTLGPDSTTLPRLITTMRSARSAAKPRSWVMSSTEVPSSWVSVSKWSRICCCTVTSSAEVGSSAMSSSGRAARPIAMSARCFIPPENSCGYWLTRRSASPRPASLSSSTVRFFTSARPEATPLALTASAIWKPTDHTGLRLVIGSCGTRPMCLPRNCW